jgi:GTPase SAR1 family protein
MNIKRVGQILGGVAIGVGAIAAAPFTGGGSLLAGAAALGLGTTAAVVGAVVAGAAGGGIVSYFTGENIDCKLGMIGMKSSGKSTLLKNLGGVKEVKKDTLKEKYDSFVYTLSSDKKIFIDKGKDIGGNVNFMVDYKQIIEENSVVFYFFNINKYLTEIDYKRQCNMRLAFIYSSIKDKKFALIASHSDHSQLLKNELEEKVLDEVKGKDYSKLFNDNLYIVNLTDKSEFKKLIEKIFS